MKTILTILSVAALLECPVYAQVDASVFVNGDEVFLHKNRTAQLKTFSARIVGGKTYLGWVTENLNGDGTFIVYRSLSGEHYEIIGVSKAETTVRSMDLGYFFIDNSPILSASVYYKVVYLGTDNSVFSSQEIAAKAPAPNFAQTVK